ncbi:MAG: hypothetical protein ABW328_19660 [Ilumatobacteraceae bacterium]
MPAPTEDPIRVEVERRLHAIAGATIVAPCAALCRARRRVLRRIGAVGARVTEPARVATSLIGVVVRRDRPAAPVAPSDGTADVPPPPSAPSSTAASPSPVRGRPADRTELAIDEYESLAASQVVARLPALTPDELRTVRGFESGHRGRRTVLGKIDQLLVEP